MLTVLFQGKPEALAGENTESDQFCLKMTVNDNSVDGQALEKAFEKLEIGSAKPERDQTFTSGKSPPTRYLLKIDAVS